MTDIILSVTGKVFDVPMTVDLQIAGGPFSFSLKTEEPVSLTKIWDLFSQQLESVTGVSLPTIPEGPWHQIMDVEIFPSLWITPDKGTGNTSAYLLLTLEKELSLGTHHTVGPVEITIEPDITIVGLVIGYDGAGDGLTVKARIKTSTSSSQPEASTGKSKEQLVNFPFPLPAQNSVSAFHLNYLGIGQRVGPTVQVSGSGNPMEAIFNQLETQLVGSDPETIITQLARDFYQPDRDWFIAADISLRELRLRVLFNDPVMYGLEVSIPMTNPPSFFSGLLFEILYQKLGPNLGVYYGALTLPYSMRRIPLEGFILILPGFSAWIYTNGDFRINVGWPISPNNSIGISIDILTGWAGFYFAKLRSGDNPGAVPSVDYNPILEFGIGIEVNAYIGIDAGPLSASLNVNLAASFQGLLAWKASGSISNPPDHYWFAGSASISVVLQGCVDLAIIKASVLVSFSISAGIAFEKDYKTIIPVSASVRVEVSLKVIFFTIHLSFHTTVDHTFYVGNGDKAASINGPQADGLNVMPAAQAWQAMYHQAKEYAMLQHAQVADALRPLHDVHEPLRFRASPASDVCSNSDASAQSALAMLELVFVLQPTVVYDADGNGRVNLIASLVMDCPAPNQPPLASPGAASGYEMLIIKLVKWLLTFVTPESPDEPLSITLQRLMDMLGSGSAEPGAVFGGRSGFVSKLKAFFADTLCFTLRGIGAASPAPFDVAAVLPMFDVLRLQANGNTIDFSRFNPTPDNYTEALNLYFANMGLVGTRAPEGTPPRQRRTLASPPDGPSMASYLFGDYFLLIARYTLNTLIQDAQKYEKQQDKQLKRWARELTDSEGMVNPFTTLNSLNAWYNVNPTQELNSLLDNLAYWSIAGFGSRYLMSGLQLPEPAMIPPVLTPQNVAGVPTATLFQLSGQQYEVSGSPDDNHATLSFTPGFDVTWIQFADASPANAATDIALPDMLPADPDPLWIFHNTASSPEPVGADIVLVQPLAAAVSAPLGYQLKNSQGWDDEGKARTLYNFPQPLLNRLQATSPLQLSLEGIKDDESADSPVAISGTATLQIRLSLTQVVNTTLASVGSPVTLTPSPGTTPQANIYQLGGTDESTRELIYQALQSDLSTARIRLLYLPPGKSGWVSDDLDLSSVLVAKLNLSTLNQVEQVSLSHMMMFSRITAADDSDSAMIDEVSAFLRLIWELSVVRAPGYYLHYRTVSGEGLPAELFADSASAVNSPAGPGQDTVPGSSSGSADLMIVVEFEQAPASTLMLEPYHNSLSIPADSEISSLICGLSDANGQPLYAWQSAYAPGNIGFAATWTPAIEPSPEPTIPVVQLYHLMQYQIVGNESVWRDSVWSLPVGPTETRDGNSPDITENLWQLRQLIPLLPFYNGSDSPSDSNPYAIVGQTATLAFRLCDTYGNPLAQQHSTQFTPYYSDPLIALGEWPGLQSAYYFTGDTTENALVMITLAFTPNVVDTLSSPGGDDLAQWIRMRDKYQSIINQLEDVHTHFALNCSLVNNAIPGDPQPYLLEFATQILNDINTHIHSSPSARMYALESELQKTFSIPLNFADLMQQPHDIVDISVAVSAWRDPELVDSEVVKNLPQVAQVSYALFARLDLPPLVSPASPDDSNKSNISVFAHYFEQAFANFDGQQGQLKLAQRAGEQVSNSSNNGQDLWAVRFSTRQGFSLDLSSDLVYFALRPLNIKPRSGTVDGIQYNDIDMDAWASQCLNAFDRFLSPQMGVAVAILDKLNQTSYYDKLMHSKQTLAKSISTGLVPVLQKDLDNKGDLAGAQQRLQQALLETLASAYTISTIVQVPADVGVQGIADNVSPQQAPQLYGSLQQPVQQSPQVLDGDTTKLYQFSPLVIDLASGKQWATSLLTVSRPGDQSSITLPLQYSASYLQHDFESDKSQDGYIPSAWLKFALADDAPLLMPITDGGSPVSSPAEMAIIPIPLPFEPPLPVLVSQRGLGISLDGSPGASPMSLREEIQQALQWCYQVELSLKLASQDEFYFDFSRNVLQNPSLQFSRQQQNARQLDSLFAALAQFDARWPALSAQFNHVLQQAYGGSLSVPPAGDVVEEVSTLFENVADSWPTDWEPKLRLSASQHEIDHFCLNFSITGGRFSLQLRGRTDQQYQNPAIWPVLQYTKGFIWTPDRQQAIQDPDGWWAIEMSFSEPPEDLSTLTLCWEPLSILEYQSAQFTAWTLRNAELVPDQPTNPLFIYQTDETSFPDALIPLIERDVLPEVNVGAISLAVLKQVMQDIMTPLTAVSSLGVNPVLNLQIDYASTLVPGQAGQPPLLAESPVLLVSALELGSTSPLTLADEIAQEVWEWYQGSQPHPLQGRMQFAFTLFGSVNGQQLPLVQINNIPVIFS